MSDFPEEYLPANDDELPPGYREQLRQQALQAAIHTTFTEEMEDLNERTKYRIEESLHDTLNALRDAAPNDAVFLIAAGVLAGCVDSLNSRIGRRPVPTEMRVLILRHVAAHCLINAEYATEGQAKHDAVEARLTGLKGKPETATPNTDAAP